jgi:hypothetical protein
MPRIRLAASASLGAFALLTAMAWVPATALAQTSGAITITSAGPDGSGDPYDLTVVADNTLGDTLSSMTVHLSQGSTDVYDITNMQPVDTTDPTNQTWQPATPVPAVDLPAGTYTITVDATDTSSGNDEVDNGLAAGTISISYSSTNVTVTPSTTFVTEGSQSVTFTGTVTGTAEDGTLVPIQGVPVSVSTDSGANITTNSNGDFSYTDSNVTAATNYTFSVAAADDGSYPAGSSGPIAIADDLATTSINVTPSETSISQGAEQIIFNGTVLAAPAGGGAAVPLSGVTVSVSGGGSSGTATTGSDGSFSYEATGVSAATTFTFNVAGGDLYGPGNASVPIGEAAAQTAISVTPSQNFVTQGATSVNFSGTVSVTPPGGASVGIGSGIPVTVSVGGTPVATVPTTDVNGDFTYSATGLTQGTSYEFTVAPTSLYGEADQTVAIPADPASTAITVTPSQPQIELGSQDVTFNGSVSMTPPGATNPVSIGAGIPVTITGGSTNTVVTTDGSGDFSLPVSDIPEATTYTFSIGSPPDPLYSGSSATPVQITAAEAATSKIAIPDPAVITFGAENSTITGTVTGLNASSNSIPIAGAPVYLNGGSAPVANTASDGTFSYQTPDLTSTTTYTFSINADADNSLYTATSTPINVEFGQGSTTMAIVSSPTVVSAGPTPVTFTGTVDVTPAGTGASAEPIGANVPVQVSINGGIPGSAGTTNASGVFTYSDPAAEPGDEYDFTVAGATYYNQATSDFAFNKESTTLTVNPSETTVTEGAQSVTFSGTATGMVPGGSTVAVAGAPVLLNGQPISGGVTTDSTGQFSYTVGGIAKATSYDFSIAGTNSYTAATADISISPSQARTRITDVSVSPSKLKYGQKATLRGIVQYQSGSTWTNLGGTTVDVAEGKTHIANARASTGGAFSAALPSTHGFAWSATVSAGVLTQQTAAIGNLAISVPMRVSAFGASLGVNGSVGTSGCLLVTAPVKYGPLTTVQIQYATGSRGPWHLLGRLQLHNLDRKAKGCAGSNESYFSGAIKALNDNAYYRADFPANDSFQGAVSKVIHSFRYATKITSFKVGPGTVKKGQIVTVTGQLWRKVGRSWKPYANRSIQVVYNEKGTSFWSDLGKAVSTNSKGDFRRTAQGGGGNFVAVIYAVYAGSSVDLATRTQGVGVSIKSENAGTRLVPASPSAARRLQLSAQLAPPGPELDLLARQEQLLLGVMPASVAIL